METPKDRRYSKDHEWARLQADGTCQVGITFFAQDQLGDVVYVNLPRPGTVVTQSLQMGEVESVKAVSELYSPVSGEVIEVNNAVNESPELLNGDPYERGWLITVRPTEPSEMEALMDAAQYDALTSS